MNLVDHTSKAQNAVKFQSLSRDSGHLNLSGGHQPPAPGGVSIPQSGFGAFELLAPNLHTYLRRRVSIPQSGFGAFEPRFMAVFPCPSIMFQSLSRDSGHLNLPIASAFWNLLRVSIPQSGFGAFEPPDCQRILESTPRFNPSVGIRGI